MYSAILVTPDHGRRHVDVYSTDAISALLNDAYVDSLSSHDGLIDFWFCTSPPTGYRANLQATEYLFVNTSFTAADVPLLYGGVIVCSRTADGRLLGLETTDFGRLHSPAWLSRRRIQRRFARARRRAHPTNPDSLAS
jgi:hypothetical protein